MSHDTPLHIISRQSAFVLPLDKPLTIRYEARGAAHFCLYSEELHQAGAYPSPVDSETGEFTISVTAAIGYLVDSHARLIANLSKAQDSEDAQRSESYLTAARRAFRRVLQRDPTGVPIPVGVTVLAETRDSTAALRHDFLIEVPREQFEAALDQYK